MTVGMEGPSDPGRVTLLGETISRDRAIRSALREGTTHEDRTRLDALLTLINRNADALARSRSVLTDAPGCERPVVSEASGITNHPLDNCALLVQYSKIGWV